jgi:hypothetical protein
MHQSQQPTQRQETPLEAFEQNGAKFCFMSNLFKKGNNSYFHFLQEIYGINDPWIDDRIVNAVNGRSELTSEDAWYTIQNALNLYLTSRSDNEAIPLLVFAYCHQASLRDAREMSGQNGDPGDLARHNLLAILSRKELPDFCVQLLKRAGSSYDEKYIEKIVRGEGFDMEEAPAFKPPQNPAHTAYMAELLEKEKNNNQPSQHGATGNTPSETGDSDAWAAEKARIQNEFPGVDGKTLSRIQAKFNSL